MIYKGSIKINEKTFPLLINNKLITQTFPEARMVISRAYYLYN